MVEHGAAEAVANGGIGLAWLIPLLPLAGFLVVAFWGKRTPGRGAFVSIAFTGAAFLAALSVFWKVLQDGSFHAESSLEWFNLGSFSLELGVRIDGLAAVMLVVVTFVSLLVQIYSTGYMAHEPRFTWYYAALSLFTGSMLILVVANNLLMLLVGWEGVGICSYLLIGHFWEEKKNSDAAIKAFLTTRTGDVAMLFGISR